MFIEEMEWKPLTDGERRTLEQELKAARIQSVDSEGKISYWTYQAKLIQELLDNPLERGEECNLGDAVALVGSNMVMWNAAEYGITGLIKRPDRSRALEGLPGVLGLALRQFFENVASNKNVNPFDGSPSKRARGVPKRIEIEESDK